MPQDVLIRNFHDGFPAGSNPEVELRGETEVGVEGCLSFPEITGDIERGQSVLVRADVGRRDVSNRGERSSRPSHST